MAKHRTLLAAAVAVLLVLSGSAHAQELGKLKDTTPEERAEVLTQMMKEKLGLTDPELSKVKAINLDSAKKMDPIIKGNERPLERLRQAREIGGAKDAELKKVLTDTQYQKYIAAKEEMRQRVEEKLTKAGDSQ